MKNKTMMVIDSSGNLITIDNITSTISILIVSHILLKLIKRTFSLQMELINHNDIFFIHFNNFA